MFVIKNDWLKAYKKPLPVYLVLWQRIVPFAYEAGRRAGQFVYNRWTQGAWRVTGSAFKSRPRPVHYRRDIHPWTRQWFPGGYRVQYDMYRIVKHGLSRYMLKKIISLGLGNLLSQLARNLPSGRKRYFLKCLEDELPYVWTSKYQASKALYRCFYKSLRWRGTSGMGARQGFGRV